MQQSLFKRKFIGFLLVIITLFGNLSTFAQIQSGVPSKTQTASKDSKTQACNSGYVGSVNYTKVIQTSSSGRSGSYTNMKRTYQTTINVRDDGRQQGSVSSSGAGLSGGFNLVGQSSGSVDETDDRLSVSEKDDYCRLTLAGGKDKRNVRCESRWKRQTNASGTKNDAQVNISIRGDKMKLSIGNLPEMNGTSTTDTKSSCTGTCGKDTPVSQSGTIPVTNAGEQSMSTGDREIAFNPTSFNRLSGSWSNTEPTPGGTVTETIQWNLSRCAPPLELANLRFEEKRVQKPQDWMGVDGESGATDGNIIKVKATVFNNGGETAYANVKFTETSANVDLPNNSVSVAVKPGEQRDVEYEWDTTGFAWDDFQKPKSNREIKAALEGTNQSETEKIKILPRPVILVHGLWSNAAAWAEYPTYLKEAHSFAWKGFAVGADPNHGKMNTGDHPGNSGSTNTIFQNAQELAKQIKWTREQTNSWHVDIVAHSMGGLISRQYINTFMLPVFDGKPEVKRLIMLGTPNMGSPCADMVGNIFEFFGENDMNAMRELRPSVVAEFNRNVTNRRGVKFSILAGIPVPRICQKPVWGDGVVEIGSALYNITDQGFAPRHHIDLTGREDFINFALPRLAIGPRRSQTEETARLEQQTEDTFALAEDSDEAANDRDGFAGIFQKVSYKTERSDVSAKADEANLQNITTRQKVELKAKETKEIEIPIKDGAAAGILLVASPAVSAVLIDEQGATVGESKAGMNAYKEMFRMIAVEKKVAGAIWKLKLVNLSDDTTMVYAGGFVNDASEIDSLRIEAGKPLANGTFPLAAKWLQNNQLVLNAKITAEIEGQSAKTEFFDDGKHADGAASDGVYGAITEKLGAGVYLVKATATANNQTKTAVAVISNGTTTTTKMTAPPSKPAARRRGK